jgi:diaminohydroxyphosphoribosylaminopyrimidine deaminase/5-amino-6-(5-phosphoribosylamino)uracil reductase
VTWKFAGTLDGRSAAADGTSQWITGEGARADVHTLRSQCDAIVVGTGTVLADDPHLTVRDPVGRPIERDLQPTRVVVGLRPIPAEARVLDDAAPTVRIESREPKDVLEALVARDCQHVWLEGGPRLAASFVAAGLVDEVVAYVAPVLLGAGRPAVADLGITTISEALRLDLTDVARFGDDVRLTLTTKPAADLPSVDEGTS